jgi:hypothetical protein
MVKGDRVVDQTGGELRRAPLTASEMSSQASAEQGMES